MKKNTWIEKLRKQDACVEGISWASEQESPQAAWDACERGDWMLWAWGRNCGNSGSESHRKLVLCCVKCEKTGVKYVKDKEVKKLVKKSLKTTERWAKGEKGVTLEDVKKNNIYHSSAAIAATGVAAGAASGADVWYVASETTTLKESSDIIRTIQPNCPKFKKRVTV